ncbi:nucleoside recognition domain-containing protein [Nannocystis pusilla]|uniref:nucleoside recognition domain-containing protein n=1 Tax=Nannocystis pusilla TaxID=889268 RepID=UPI003B77E3BF
MIFAFQVLPTIVFVAALFAVLYYLGVMQLIVRVLARAMVHVFGASGPSRCASPPASSWARPRRR